MSYTQLLIAVNDQELELRSWPAVASGGVRDTQVQFVFDSLWDGFENTAVFYRCEDDVYHVALTDNAGLIPAEVLISPGTLYIGVFGKKPDGSTRTSNVLQYSIVQGAFTLETVHEPAPNVYRSLLDRIEQLEEGRTLTREDVLEMIEDAGIGGGTSSSGTAAAGYYTPAVSQPDSGTAMFSFTPSRSGMEQVDDVVLQLPRGQKGDAFVYEDFTDEQLAALVGAPGASAYEIALAEGFEGTEEEWLESLKCTDFVLPDGLATVEYVDNALAGLDMSGSGQPGTDGITFTPSVSADGVLSWTNDGGLANPAPVSIKGADGAPGANGSDGAPGKDGADGKDGITPVKGVDYFTQADKAEITASAVQAATVPGINLLHNADWGYSLVNQREHSGAVSGAYCIDRWIGSGTVTPVSEQYVTLANGTTMTQRMELNPGSLVGKKHTFSIEINGNTQSAAVSFPSSLGGSAKTASLSNCTVELGFIAGSFTLCGLSQSYVPYIKITAKSAINVQRVFLESGAVSHIENTPPATYETNLNTCKRYYVRWRDSVHRAAFPAFFNSATVARATVTLPVIMRISPSCTIGTLDVTRFIWDGSMITPTELSSVAAVNNSVTLEFAVSGGTSSKAAIMRFGQTTTVIFDAEL